MEQIEFSAQAVQQVKSATVALKGLDKILTSVSQGVKEIFTVRGYKDYLTTVSRLGKSLADQLLVMQLGFGKLKVAIAKAVAPIAEVFVPMINDAIFALIRFANALRQFFAAFTVSLGAKGAKEAAAAQGSLAKAATTAAKAARRSVMSFDQLNRLAAQTGGSGSGLEELLPDPDELVISPKIQALVDQLMLYLQPLLQMDFSPLVNALTAVWNALLAFAQMLGPTLQWLWFEILTPFVAWLVEVLSPALLNCFAGGLELVTAAIAPLLAGMQALWEGIEPVVEFIAGTVVMTLQIWAENFRNMAQMFQEKDPQIRQVFSNISQAVVTAWQVVEPALTAFREAFGATFTFVSEMALSGSNAVIGALNGILGFLANVFSGNWSQAWQNLTESLRSVVNGVIGMLNAMINRLGSALNAVIGAANRLSFTVPDWVPGLGGRHFGVNMPYVSIPQVPYLAQGAVLPANKPFLAMVGDQRHGTNVEAPLTTIQEAVALAMEDMAAGNMAGHRATVDVLRQILEAVLGIRIGDDAIAAAVERQQLRVALQRGF